MGPVPEHQLLKKEEGLFVADLLPDLDRGLPWMVGVLGRTIRALLVVDNELSDERGLDFHIFDHFF